MLAGLGDGGVVWAVVIVAAVVAVVSFACRTLTESDVTDGSIRC